MTNWLRPAKSVGERDAPLSAVELVVLLNLHPRQRAALGADRVHLPGEAFFFREKFLPGGEPLGRGDDAMICFRVH